MENRFFCFRATVFSSVPLILWAIKIKLDRNYGLTQPIYFILFSAYEVKRTFNKIPMCSVLFGNDINARGDPKVARYHIALRVILFTFQIYEYNSEHRLFLNSNRWMKLNALFGRKYSVLYHRNFLHSLWIFKTLSVDRADDSLRYHIQSNLNMSCRIGKSVDRDIIIDQSR